MGQSQSRPLPTAHRRFETGCHLAPQSPDPPLGLFCPSDGGQGTKAGNESHPQRPTAVANGFLVLPQFDVGLMQK